MHSILYGKCQVNVKEHLWSFSGAEWKRTRAGRRGAGAREAVAQAERGPGAERSDITETKHERQPAHEAGGAVLRTARPVCGRPPVPAARAGTKRSGTVGDAVRGGETGTGGRVE